MLDRIERVRKQLELEKQLEREKAQKLEEQRKAFAKNLQRLCEISLEIFGINPTLNDINNAVLQGKGEVNYYSTVDISSDGTKAWAESRLTWKRKRICKSEKHQLRVRTTKMSSDYPFTMEFIYPGSEKFSTNTLQLENIENNLIQVKGGRVIENINYNGYLPDEIREKCADKLAEITIFLKEMGCL